MGPEVSRYGASYGSCPFAALRVLIRLHSFIFPSGKGEEDICILCVYDWSHPNLGIAWLRKTLSPVSSSKDSF